MNIEDIKKIMILNINMIRYEHIKYTYNIIVILFSQNIITKKQHP